MAESLVTFESLNQVALLKRALLTRGIFLQMERTPTCLAKKGCGFALRAQPEHLSAINEECARLKIAAGGVFELDASGGWSACSADAQPDHEQP
jgi:hypothetical protein